MQIFPADVALDIACCTDVGRARDQNEDACALPPVAADIDRLGALFVVADGVGGMPGGADASRDAVAHLQALYYAASGPGQPDDRLSQAVRAVNTLNRNSPGRTTARERLTTLVAALVRGNDVWIANVGDSRAYLCRPGQDSPRQLTQDHSGAQGSTITHAIGLADDCQVDLYHYIWNPGDALVLCSDGLAALQGPEIAKIVLAHPAEEAARALVDRANLTDGSDNATALVARRSPDRPRPAANPRDTIPARTLVEPETRPSGRRFGTGLLLGLVLGLLAAALFFYFAAGGHLPGF